MPLGGYRGVNTSRKQRRRDADIRSARPISCDRRRSKMAAAHSSIPRHSTPGTPSRMVSMADRCV